MRAPKRATGRKTKRPPARKAPELREGSTMWAGVQVLRGKERAEPGKFRLKRGA